MPQKVDFKKPPKTASKRPPKMPEQIDVDSDPNHLKIVIEYA